MISSGLDSLPSATVSLLVQTVHLHQEHLTASHLDARRCSENGVGPCYVVDYQLLHAYMYEVERRAELVVQLEHLLRQKDLLFIIGYGTAIEVFHRLRILTGIDFTSIPWDELKRGDEELSYDSVVSKYLPALRESLRLTTAYASPTHVNALTRLRHLLSQPNFIYISEVESALEGPTTDPESYDVSLAALHSARKGERDFYPNLADALNFAGVVGLRKAARVTANNFLYHAYLLTTTRPLLDEQSWVEDPIVERWGYKPTLSRTPASAIYSDIVANLQPVPSVATAYTAKLLAKVAEVEGHLLGSQGFSQTGVEDITDSEWEEIADRRQVSEGFVLQLNALSELVEDPVISEFQRVYDNARVLVSDPGVATRALVDSPRRAFDIVLSISEVLRDDPTGTTGLAQLWSRAVRVEATDLSKDVHVRTYSSGPTSAPRPYLVVEQHLTGHTVLRWPSNRRFPRIVSAFNWALGLRNVTKGYVYLGTSEGAWQFDAEFPLTVKDFAVGVYEMLGPLGVISLEDGATTPIPRVDGVDPRLQWIRIVTPGFELFADSLPPSVVEPVIGLIATGPRRADVVNVYGSTSSRFVFQAWLEGMLKDAGIGD